MARWETGEPPKDDKGKYLITYIDGCRRRCVHIARRIAIKEKGDYKWYWAPMFGGILDDEVIAWQKCPEPYQG